MSWYRWLSCAVLLGLVDSAWLYLLLGVLGFVTGIGHAPLSWLVVSAVVVTGVVARAMYDLMPVSWQLRVVLLPFLALLVTWIAVGSAHDFQAVSLGLEWPLALLTGGVESSTLTAIVFAVLIVVVLWLQGRRRARDAAGSIAIARSFRAGLIVFTLVLALEAAGDLELGTRIAMGPFFVASLLGLALARAPTHGLGRQVWLWLIMAAIALIAVSGIALALFAVAVVRGGFSALREVWLDLAYAVNRSVSETLIDLLGTREAGGVDLQSASSEPSQALMLLVLLFGTVIFAALLHRLLNAPPAAKLPQMVLDLGSAECETIAARDTDVAGQLLEKLRPRWPWRRRAGGVERALPAHPGLARVYALYYQLLERARAQGIVLNPAHTPRERIASLSAAFPDLPVERLTTVFEAACYGRVLAGKVELERLSEQCDC